VKNDYSVHHQKLLEMISNPKLDNADKLKASLLFVLRYENVTPNPVPELTQALLQNNVPPERVRLLGKVLKYAGAASRSGDLFSNKNLWASSKSFIRQFRGADHNLLAHKPLLNELIDELQGGKLSTQDFPHIGSQPRENARVTDMILFVVGGATYEEARAVHEINTSRAGVRIVLGGSTVLNSAMFLEELQRLE